MPSQEVELFVLVETAAGYILTHVKEWDALSQDLQNVQESLLEPSKFNQVVSVTAICPFQNAEEALNSCKAIAAGESTEQLRDFLDQNLPKKRKKCQLGIIDPALGKHLSAFGFPIMYDRNILELTRLCRFHIKKLMKQFGESDIMKFQVGLGHSHSRTKIAMDPNRQDKPVQNAAALLENLDKMINTFAMRVKEWYCWHFPELGKIVTDNVKFAQVVRLIRVKEDFNEVRLPELIEAVDGDESIAEEIMSASGISMGQDIVEADMINIDKFAYQVIQLSEQRKHLAEYLGHKLEKVAPNLQTLVGDLLAAKLIAHSGSLTNLAKLPASTVQILGAEKALFRALKTKGNTPKYGLLFQSTFIGRAAQKNKGRVSRYLANKCSLAARIDNFATVPCNIFGEKMKDQVEARMNYLVDGVATRKNIAVMKEASIEYDEKVAEILKKRRKAEKKAKKKSARESIDSGEIEETESPERESKKRQRVVHDDDGEVESKKKRKSTPIEKIVTEKKKKRKSK